MKQITKISTSITIILLLSSCSSTTIIAPSQNPALNNISNSTAAKKKKGVMQRSLDKWLKNDWEPTVSKDKKIQKKYMQKENSKTKKEHYIDKKNRNFTLQEYVDKAAAYMKAKPNDYNSSNVHKIESLPVIGK